MVSEHLAVNPAFSPNSVKHTPQCPIANVLVHSRQEPALPLHLLFTLLLLCWQLTLGVQQHMPPVLLTKVYLHVLPHVFVEECYEVLRFSTYWV